MGAARAVTDQTFALEVLQSPKPVVVDFWAEWCVQCPRVDKLIAELAETDLGDKVTFVKMDIEASPKVAQKYEVRSVPTIIIFKQGQPVGSIPGLRPKRQVISAIESAL